MGEEQAILAAIKADPAADLPRLVLADWLDEHDDPDRATFIRTQVEAARLLSGDPRQPVLEARERELLAVYGNRWLWPWDKCGMFFRGLIALWCRRRDVSERVAEGGEGVLAWVESLRLEGDAAEVLPVLSDPWLRQVAALDLSWKDMGDAGAAAVAGSTYLARLTSLILDQNAIGDAGAAALAASPHLSRLTSLDLGENHIGDVGVMALAASPHLSRLTHLSLSMNAIGDAGAVALATSPHLSRLGQLYLGANDIGEEATACLRERFGPACHP